MLLKQLRVLKQNFGQNNATATPAIHKFVKKVRAIGNRGNHCLHSVRSSEKIIFWIREIFIVAFLLTAVLAVSNIVTKEIYVKIFL